MIIICKNRRFKRKSANLIYSKILLAKGIFFRRGFYLHNLFFHLPRNNSTYQLSNAIKFPDLDVKTYRRVFRNLNNSNGVFYEWIVYYFRKKSSIIDVWKMVLNTPLLKIPWGALLLVKLQAEACNFANINTPPWVFKNTWTCSNFTLENSYKQRSVVLIIWRKFNKKE